MREDTPSLTAAMVSFGRGVGVRGPAPDPYARALCPPPFRPLLGALEAAGPLQAPLRFGYRVASLGLVDYITLRTSAIDRAVGGSLAAGAEQLVVLGAGLDARGLRLSGLEGIPVFEVDHPATQAFKRRRIQGQTAAVGAGVIEFVSVDFAKDALDEKLLEAGFDKGAPTAWIWEGVTMYLPRAATLATLDQVAALSAKGSRLMTTYLVPGTLPGGPFGAKLVRAAFEVGGEGLRGTFRPEQMAGELTARGFTVLRDSGAVDWAADTGLSPWTTRIFRGERLVVAQR